MKIMLFAFTLLPAAATAAGPGSALSEADYRALAALLVPREVVAFPKEFTVFVRFEGAPAEAVMADLRKLYPRPMIVKAAGQDDRWDKMLGCTMDTATQTLAAVVTIHAPVWKDSAVASFSVDAVPCEISRRHDTFDVRRKGGAWALDDAGPQPASSAPGKSS